MSYENGAYYWCKIIGEGHTAVGYVMRFDGRWFRDTMGVPWSPDRLAVVAFVEPPLMPKVFDVVAELYVRRVAKGENGRGRAVEYNVMVKLNTKKGQHFGNFEANVWTVEKDAEAEKARLEKLLAGD